MKLQRSCFLRYLLIVLLLGSQCIYAAHESGLLDQEHHHSAECIVCFSQANTHAAPSPIFWAPGLFTAILFTAQESKQPVVAQGHSYSIRAPPV